MKSRALLSVAVTTVATEAVLGASLLAEGPSPETAPQNKFASRGKAASEGSILTAGHLKQGLGSII